jgi:putative transcriptional regulator
MKSLQGHLLVASPKLVDPNFFNTVVLLVQHGSDGALGLVLNRPLQATIQDVWQGESDCVIQAPLHQGGPCEGPLMVVHGAHGSSEMQVCEGIYFCTSSEQIEGLVSEGGIQAKPGAVMPIKFFVGYAGWTAGQLEAELADESWFPIDANTKAVFEGDEHLWSDLIRAIARAPVTGIIDPRRVPDDPSVN